MWSEHTLVPLACVGVLPSKLTFDLQVCGNCKHRYADVLAEYHDDDHLVKFEELLEAAVDLDKIPDEYLICASYDAGLQVCAPMQMHTATCIKLTCTLSLMPSSLPHALTCIRWVLAKLHAAGDQHRRFVQTTSSC